MAMHDYHPGLPGYSPDQILHDGCPECERRGADVELALAYMDDPTFARAWQRAIDWERPMRDVSSAEAPLLRVLLAVRRRREALTA